ncbi:MAG: hypothetical protein IJR45_01145 [Firmicutes bacterium]|nr:hypothetical protein [Bacillota bacterium]MBQ9603998.1 hypothetical protein [Bacillota bacterium]
MYNLAVDKVDSLERKLCFLSKYAVIADTRDRRVEAQLQSLDGSAAIQAIVCVHQRYTCKPVKNADFVCSSTKTRFPSAD